MTKYLLMALAALALAASGWAWIEHTRAGVASERAQAAQEHAKLAEKALTKANEQAALLRASSLARQQELNRLRQQSDERKKALDEALQAHPDWARTPVPDSVWDSLTRPAGAASQARPGLDGADARTRPAGRP